MNVSTLRAALRLALLSLVVGALAPGEGHAYRLSQVRLVNGTYTTVPVACGDADGYLHRKSYRIPWWFNSASPTSRLLEVAGGVGAWDAVTPATYDGYLGGYTTRGKAYDGYNTVTWSRPSCGGCLAVTWNWFNASAQQILESDIEFDKAFTWSTTGGQYDVRSVMTHEWGHVLGVAHTNLTSTPIPTMRATYSGTGMRSLETDDKSAANCIYTRYPPTYSATRAGGYETSSLREQEVAPIGGSIDAAIAEASDGLAKAGMRANPDGVDEDAPVVAATGTPSVGAVSLSARMSAGRALLRFTLPAADRVVLEIFNVAGRRIATVADADLDAGSHELAWGAASGPGAAPGVYFAKLRTSAGESSARVLYVR
jgi:hypothetical protein